jgi:hypothetical protein
MADFSSVLASSGRFDDMKKGSRQASQRGSTQPAAAIHTATISPSPRYPNLQINRIPL